MRPWCFTGTSIPIVPGVWPGVSTSVTVVSPRVSLAVGDVHVALHDGPVGALPRDDGVPVGCAHQDPWLVGVLNVEPAACVVVVSVADDQIFDLAGVEPHFFNPPTSTSRPSSALLSASKRMMPSLVGMAHAPTSLKPK